jgi:subtilisin-like proprotein convertase family protein
MPIKYTFRLFIFIIFLSVSSRAQVKDPWSKAESREIPSEEIQIKHMPHRYKLFHLDLKSIKNEVWKMARENASGRSYFRVSFPDESGKLQTYLVKESHVMHPDLARRYPDNKTFKGYKADDGSKKIRFSINEQGLHAMFIGKNRDISYIDPYSKDKKNYILYKRRDVDFSGSGFLCLTKDFYKSDKLKKAVKVVDDKKLRVYRLALASTGEYSEYHINAAGLQNGTDAEKKAAVLAEMTTLITRVNDVYENDLAISFQLIANTDDLIYLDAATDPYTNDSGSKMLGENQTTCDNVIGSAGYDIGHVLSTGGGGVANRGSVCVASSKAKGVTGSSNPVGDLFYFDFVAHEFGHQMGANHTFNSEQGNCGGGNINLDTSVEPGSGSTLMAYAGLCSPENVQGHSDFYFHTVSIDEIWTNLVSGSGDNCSTKTSLVNNKNIPLADAGHDYTIPKSTPYVLRGAGSDADNDPITFCWEQIDTGITDVPPSETAVSGALYRSFQPSESPDRYMPSLKTLAKGGISSTWEATPAVAREMNFSLTVRDNNPEAGQVAKDKVKITVTDAAGPFKVTSQNTDNTVWKKNTQEVITWDVAGTKDNGINVTLVNIYLSTDNGNSYDKLLLQNTPNDGTQSVNVPDTEASKCLVKVEAVDHIFFAVNSKVFSIGEFKEKCITYSASDTPLQIPDNDVNGVISAISIPDNYPVESLRVSVKIKHTWVSDLTITLISPSGKEIELIGGACFGANSDIDVTFDDDGSALKCGSSPPVISGNIIPTQDLSSLYGENSIGKWHLRVVDNGADDEGTLESWSLELCTSEPVLGTGHEELPGFNVYPNPAGDRVQVEFYSKETGKTYITLYDLLGRQVLDKQYDSGDVYFKKTVGLGHISSGLYYLKVKKGGQISVKKLLIR